MSYRSKIRSNSGVFPVPIYTKPFFCGGSCIFCPKANDIPSSYIENEDTLFAKACSYSPAIQFQRFRKRIYNFINSGPIPIELIILGGSFSSHSREYREKFMNDLYTAMKGSAFQDSYKRFKCIPSVVTVESRPDQISMSECDFLRKLGVSKVEIGLQHTSDKVLYFNQRGHDQSSIIKATQFLKDGGFKVGYHIMIGLPNSTNDDDLKMLTSTIWKKEYLPDYLKIYPCVLLKNPLLQPKLFELYKAKKWTPINSNDVILLLQALNKAIPSYVRISRIQRQFDLKSVIHGVNPGVRIKSGINFSDVRSREVGHVSPDFNFTKIATINEKITRMRNDVYFELSTIKTILLGMARIRIRNDILIIRELKIFGKATPVGDQGLIQGNGLGKRLLRSIENFGQKHGLNTILVNASPGAQTYFLKNGYFLSNCDFLKKDLKSIKLLTTPCTQMGRAMAFEAI